MQTKQKNKIKKLRQKRTRARIIGSDSVPRLSVFRSNRNMAAQLIDDLNGKTIVSVSSYNKNDKLQKSEVSLKLGEEIAKKANDLGIKKAVFDRGKYKFHGRVKAVCIGANKGGLKI